MNFADRLRTALIDGVLTEMAWFALPEPIPLPTDRGDIVPVKYLDMRWEDYRNPYISRWGQWTHFCAELPVQDYRRRFLVWDGTKAHIADREVEECHPAPKGWWKMAQGMDETGQEVLHPKVRRAVET